MKASRIEPANDKKGLSGTRSSYGANRPKLRSSICVKVPCFIWKAEFKAVSGMIAKARNGLLLKLWPAISGCWADAATLQRQRQELAAEGIWIRTPRPR